MSAQLPGTLDAIMVGNSLKSENGNVLPPALRNLPLAAVVERGVRTKRIRSQGREMYVGWMMDDDPPS